VKRWQAGWWTNGRCVKCSHTPDSDYQRALGLTASFVVPRALQRCDELRWIEDEALAMERAGADHFASHLRSQHAGLHQGAKKQLESAILGGMACAPLEEEVLDASSFPLREIRELLILQLFRGGKSAAMAPENVWALDALQTPLALKFRYHFATGRDTERVDRPGWLFSFLRKSFKAYEPVLRHQVQSMLLEITSIASSSSNLPNPMRELDCATYFLRGLILLAKWRLRRWVGQLMESDHLLSLAVGEALSFDRWVQSEGSYAVQREKHPWIKWPQVVDVFCLHEARFRRWLEMDKRLALRQQSLDSGPEGRWRLETLPAAIPSSFRRSTTTTHFARRTAILFRAVSERYSGILKIRQKLAFVREVQRPLLQSFVGDVKRQSESCSLRSVFQDPPTADFCRWQEYCSAMNSAEYIVSMLRDAEDDEQLVALQQHAGDSASLFAQELHALQSLLETMISKSSLACCRGVIDAFYGYSRHLESGMHLVSSDSAALAELVLPALRILQQALAVASMNLMPASFQKFWQMLASALDAALFDVISGAALGRATVVQCIRRDFPSIFKAFAQCTSLPSAHFPQSDDAMKLLVVGAAQARRLVATLKALDDGKEGGYATDALVQVGVSFLEPGDAKAVLQQQLECM
jgi:hypothetical protein